MIATKADESLARLVESVAGSPLDFVVLRAVIEEASDAGACRALAALGLEDARARRDMDELRELLGTWRDVKKSAWQTVARWVVRILLASVMLSLVLRADLLALTER